MSIPVCAREAEALDAVLQGGWPSSVDADLRAHVDACPVCADVVAVAVAMRDEQCAGVPAGAGAVGRSGLVARRAARPTGGGAHRRAADDVRAGDRGRLRRRRRAHRRRADVVVGPIHLRRARRRDLAGARPRRRHQHPHGLHRAGWEASCCSPSAPGSCWSRSRCTSPCRATEGAQGRSGSEAQNEPGAFETFRANPGAEAPGLPTMPRKCGCPRVPRDRFRCSPRASAFA